MKTAKSRERPPRCRAPPMPFRLNQPLVIGTVSMVVRSPPRPPNENRSGTRTRSAPSHLLRRGQRRIAGDAITSSPTMTAGLMKILGQWLAAAAAARHGEDHGPKPPRVDGPR